MDISTRKQVKMLSPTVEQQLAIYHRRARFQSAGCLLTDSDHGPRGESSPIIPYAPMRRSRVFTGTRDSGSYNHHAQVVKYKGRYFFGFSNGRKDELTEGQRLMVSMSRDSKNWSPPNVVAGGREQKTVSHTCVGMRVERETLFMLGRQDEALEDPTSVGMRRVDPQQTTINIFATVDGKTWRKSHSLQAPIRCIFEAPRTTQEGTLVCVAALRKGAAILRWPAETLLEQPHIVPVPQPQGASFPYGEGSWYQTDQGRIIVFWRDEGESCRLWVNYSDDDGHTFSEPMISDIPDSMSRVYAGRLPDGRFYLCNNAFATLLDRLSLMLLVGNDGTHFSRVYLLADDPTSQRCMGLLKADGYQYPCCLPDENRLLVGYSVNKEDMECGVLDTPPL